MRRWAGLGAVVVLALGVGLGAGSCSDDEAADVKPSSNVALTASFSHEPDYGYVDPTNCPLRSVAFTDTSTGDPETWSWDFGGGRTSTEQNPTISPRGLVLEVTLTVTRGDETAHDTQQLSFATC